MAVSIPKINVNISRVLFDDVYQMMSDEEAIIDVSEAIFTDCKKNGVDEKVNSEVRIALVEALNNVAEHAYRGERNHIIDVRLFIRKDILRLTIKDYGGPNLHGVEPIKLNIDPDDIQELPVGGFGLNIMNKLMNRVHYHREEGVNVLIMDRKL